MKTIIFRSTLLLCTLATVLLTSCDGEDGMDGAMGLQGEQGIQGPPGEDGTDASATPSIYTRSGRLNSSFESISGTPAPVGPILRINKVYDDSIIEVFFNSNITSGTFNSGTRFVEFQIRLNGTVGITDNRVPVGRSGATVSISLFELFEDLPAGEHEIQIYARTNEGGSSTEVGLDPGGFGGRIVAKETF